MNPVEDPSLLERIHLPWVDQVGLERLLDGEDSAGLALRPIKLDQLVADLAQRVQVLALFELDWN